MEQTYFITIPELRELLLSFCDLRTLHALIYVNKAFNKSISNLKTAHIDHLKSQNLLNSEILKHNNNLRFNQGIIDLIIIGAVNKNDARSINHLLYFGITVSSKIVKKYKLYDNFETCSKKVPALNYLKNQVKLWRSIYNHNNSHNLLNYFNEGASFNCRNEYGLTFIEILASKNDHGLEWFMFLIKLKVEYKLCISTVLREPIETLKLRITKQFDDSCNLDARINVNDLCEIIACKELAIEAIIIDDAIMLKKLLSFGMGFSNVMLDNSVDKPKCHSLLVEQNNKNMALWNAVNELQVEIALKDGAQINSIKPGAGNALLIAITNNNIELAHALIKAGIDVKCIGSVYNALHYAADKLNIEGIQLIINYRKDIVDLPTHEGQTPLGLLLFASLKNYIHLYLIELKIHKSDTETTNKISDCCSGVKLLIEAGADINCLNKIYHDTIIWDLYRFIKDLRFVTLLMDNGANLFSVGQWYNILTNSKKPKISYVSEDVDVLLYKLVDLELEKCKLQACDQNRLLLEAVYIGDVNNVVKRLALNADIFSKNYANMNAIDLAVSNDDKRMKTILAKHLELHCYNYLALFMLIRISVLTPFLINFNSLDQELFKATVVNIFHCSTYFGIHLFGLNTHFDIPKFQNSAGALYNLFVLRRLLNGASNIFETRDILKITFIGLEAVSFCFEGIFINKYVKNINLLEFKTDCLSFKPFK